MSGRVVRVLNQRFEATNKEELMARNKDKGQVSAQNETTQAQGAENTGEPTTVEVPDNGGVTTSVEAAGETAATTVAAPRKKMTPEERKIKQNAYYKQYRAKIRADETKEAKYREMKRKASKKFQTKVKAEREAGRQAQAAQTPPAGNQPQTS